MGDEFHFQNTNTAHNKTLFKFNSGALSFKVKIFHDYVKLIFLSNVYPYPELFFIFIGAKIGFCDRPNDEQHSIVYPNFERWTEYRRFFILFHNSWIIIGSGETHPSNIVYQYKRVHEPIQIDLIGYFRTENIASWIFEGPPPRPVLKPSISINSGKEKWVQMTLGAPLPPDAFIGGIEEEPLYVIRAAHGRGLCPGIYKQFKKQAAVALGDETIVKTHFEILCGYDFEWVAEISYHLKHNGVPHNAVKGGYPGYRNSEPFLIGRAYYNGHLLVGKIDLRQNCLLPYCFDGYGEFLTIYNFEILVWKNCEPRQLMALQSIV